MIAVDFPRKYFTRKLKHKTERTNEWKNKNYQWWSNLENSRCDPNRLDSIQLNARNDLSLGLESFVPLSLSLSFSHFFLISIFVLDVVGSLIPSIICVSVPLIIPERVLVHTHQKLRRRSNQIVLVDNNGLFLSKISKRNGTRNFDKRKYNIKHELHPNLNLM